MRKIKRLIAHSRMKKSGCVRVNKGNPSFFARKWRDYIHLRRFDLWTV